MAQKVSIVLIDDIDGGDADETVSFSLDGTSYEIDLASANAARLREALAPYVGHARKVGSGRRAAAKKSGASGGTREIREWARSNGWPDLGDRGRVPADVQQAYDAAH
ncbi:histone-like nucleoid-structuring protein Lsr2 [Nocardioides jiangxiensis]|uniref:Lsr2 family protein n=1 Tax=Nocardioides jiangxiensis TaxID=3064524 RepID=A0ABT9B5H9_9ACTN|nr:Lsr2 family protein [Nocardioides sp. WY-20]MDO7868561.1 Lsr2 family protein [Nocardioides sp. WY-20]